MQLQIVGCGDAFGTGGRFNTCFHLVGKNINTLIDCGASSLVGMNKLAIDRNSVSTILITHFHADHVGGVPFFILEANYVLKRKGALTIAGPPGLKARYAEMMERAYPGTARPAALLPADTARSRDWQAQRDLRHEGDAIPRRARRARRAVPRLSLRGRRQDRRLFRRHAMDRQPSSISGAMPTSSSARPIRATSRSIRIWR